METQLTSTCARYCNMKSHTCDERSNSRNWNPRVVISGWAPGTELQHVCEGGYWVVSIERWYGMKISDTTVALFAHYGNNYVLGTGCLIDNLNPFECKMSPFKRSLKMNLAMSWALWSTSTVSLVMSSQTSLTMYLRIFWGCNKGGELTS